MVGAAGRPPSEPAGSQDLQRSMARARPWCGRLPDVEPLSAVPKAVPRQRWRLVLSRSVEAPPLVGRDLTDAWEDAIEASGLPLFRPLGRARARVAFGAPIPATLVAERELADILLTEWVAAWRVREAIADRVPVGWRLVDLHDVWLGRPALPGEVAAADYRIEVNGAADPQAVAAAAVVLLTAAALPRDRPRGGSVVRYDLRPLLLDVAVADPGPPLLLRVRTRFHPVLGTGRPEEVLAALGEAADTTLDVGFVVRERLILADELD